MMNAKGKRAFPRFEQSRRTEGQHHDEEPLSFVAIIDSTSVMPTMAVTAARRVEKRATIARAVASEHARVAQRTDEREGCRTGKRAF